LEDMEKLKIFKEHTPKPRKARGGVLSGAGMGQTDDSQPDNSQSFRQSTGLGC